MDKEFLYSNACIMHAHMQTGFDNAYLKIERKKKRKLRWQWNSIYNYLYLITFFTPVCSLSIHAKLPDLKNHGKVTATLLMIGEYGQGETGRGKMPKEWDGTTGINIPYFGTQAPYQLYLQVSHCRCTLMDSYL